MHFIKKNLKKIFAKFGYEVSYADKNPKMYRYCLKGAISVKKPFNIIQVGANDGKHNDPIYDFVKSHKECTNIVLVEPVSTVIPYLRKNYSYHPSSKVINKAIGNQNYSSMRLYGIEQNYWDDIDVKYGNDWPDYRIPTGITTADKSQLLSWISKNVRSDNDPSDIIKEIDIEVVHPGSIVNESENMDDVHLLQVDAEGMDHEIVYSFFDASIFPNIVNIESSKLTQPEDEKYSHELTKRDYSIYEYRVGEKLAIKHQNE